MTSTRTKELKAIPLFSRLSDTDLQFLAGHLDEVSVPANVTLITEGKGNHAFFVLLDGQADVSVGGQHRRTLGPGDFFGEISMMELDPATATVVTRTPIRAAVASHVQFRALKGNETVILHLKAAMGERLHADRKPAP
jgi:CRP/FNR family cyclic AMP-dependent transcriptional regulator